MTKGLSDKSIKSLMLSGLKIVDPFEEKFIQPSSIDLRLSNIFYRYTFNQHTLGEKLLQDQIQRGEFESLELKPMETVFIGLYEKINIPRHLRGFVYPRSSVTRLGLTITPVYMNPGYSGYLPLTVTNHSSAPISVLPGRRVAQLILTELDVEPEKEYKNVEDSKYYDEMVAESRLYSDQELEDLVESVASRKLPSLAKYS